MTLFSSATVSFDVCQRAAPQNVWADFHVDLGVTRFVPRRTSLAAHADLPYHVQHPATQHRNLKCSRQTAEDSSAKATTQCETLEVGHHYVSFGKETVYIYT